LILKFNWKVLLNFWIR